MIEGMEGNEPWIEGKRDAEKVIEALRAAIEQPAPVPYGWMRSGGGWVYTGEFAEHDAKIDAKQCGGDWQPLPFGKFLPPTCIDCTRRKAGEAIVGAVVDGVCESKLEREK